MFLDEEIITLNICDLILSFSDLLLGLYLMGLKVYPIDYDYRNMCNAWWHLQ